MSGQALRGFDFEPRRACPGPSVTDHPRPNTPNQQRLSRSSFAVVFPGRALQRAGRRYLKSVRPRLKPAVSNAAACGLAAAGCPSIVSRTRSRRRRLERCLTSASAARATIASPVSGRTTTREPRRSAMRTTRPPMATSNALELRGRTNGSRAGSPGIGSENTLAGYAAAMSTASSSPVSSARRDSTASGRAKCAPERPRTKYPRRTSPRNSSRLSSR